MILVLLKTDLIHKYKASTSNILNDYERFINELDINFPYEECRELFTIFFFKSITINNVIPLLINLCTRFPALIIDKYKQPEEGYEAYINDLFQKHPYLFLNKGLNETTEIASKKDEQKPIKIQKVLAHPFPNL